MDDFNDERFHATGIGAILIFEGQICNCFTVPLSIDNSAYLGQLSKIVGEVDLQIFLNKINVWFDAVTFKHCENLSEIVAGGNSQKKLRESLYRSKSVDQRQTYC